ncbi:arsenite methyltransferase [Haliscomenobacter hydrossis]|uniref:Arsenite methyltransferase n=1 Tax=Haliscomenobacter hydrossis (strain ATCC 27775 / DSM 1100 / LMG 10767 / O) TaxID=760192 RepID=F4L7B8_HALH1|nr:arsenite methyltransferase [Haliscomenobacter hydrossis]AEE53145.1 Methyltransferase type 11 [Haliscomenobacter hydrossis DSM 1100]
MRSEQELKELVHNKYSAIAQSTNKASGCCDTTCCGPSDEVYTLMADEYSGLEGYNQDADLGLGCGLPTQFAQIKPGDTVLDLGSGAGNDCFVARHETGEKGQVIGVDFSEAMIARARTNVAKLGFNNVEFRHGDIENLPVASNSVDVVVSNCVLNLVPNKANVFAEIYRVLKPGAHFSISDIVIEGDLPPALQEAAELYAGCVSGAIQKTDYLQLIRDAGFTEVTLQKEKPIILPEEILQQYLSPADVEVAKQKLGDISSITVFGKKG